MRKLWYVAIFSIVQVITFSLNTQAQVKVNPPLSDIITIKTVSGTIGRQKRQPTEKRKFVEVNLSEYESGLIFADLKVSSGGCNADLITTDIPTEDRKNNLLRTRVLSGGTKTTDLFEMRNGYVLANNQKVSKFYVTAAVFPIGLAAWYSGDCTGTYEITVYIKNGKKISNVNQNCSECRDRYYMRFSGLESLTLNSPTGHAFVTWIKLDKTNKQTIQSFAVYSDKKTHGIFKENWIIGGVKQEVRSESQNFGDTNMLIEVSQFDFNKSLEVLKGYKNSKINYNLLTRNCVDFVHNIAALIGVGDSEKESCPSDKITSPLKLPSSPMFTIPNNYIKKLLELNQERITELKYCNNGSSQANEAKTPQIDSSCRIESTLSSKESATPRETTFTLVNQSKVPIVLYWLNYQGQRVKYAEIAPNDRFEQPTYLLHPWVVTDSSGKCLRTFEAPGNVIIK